MRKQIPFFVLIFFGILIFSMGILNHYFFKTYTHDFGNYNFAFWDYSHLRISTVPTIYCNFLQDHFSLTLMYFIPVYWLLNWLTQTYTLIIIQCSLIMVAAWYSYKIIRLKSDNLWLGVGVLVYYFSLLGRYSAFSSDVNLAVISSCFIPIFIYYFETKKFFISSVILILSLLSRENIPIWFVFIFIVLIFQHRRDKKAVLFCLCGIALSVIYFIFLFKVIIPSIESPDSHYSLFNYSALGATPGEALIFVVKHPIETIKLFFVNHLTDPAYDWVKAEFYWVYFISGGFILFLRPQYIIWFIPIVAQKVLNDSFIRWGIATYYSIEVVTLLPLSVFLILSSIKQKTLQSTFIVTVCLASITMTIHKMDQQNCRIPWTRNPLKENFYDKRFYKRPFNIKKVNELLAQIPPDAKVSASNMLLPHLAQRPYIYFFPVVNDAEYLVLSVFDHYYMFSQYDDELSRLKYFSDPKWEIIAVEYPVFLFKFNESSTSNENSLDKLWGDADTLTCDYEKIDSIKGQVVSSNGESADDFVKLSENKFHSYKNSIVLLSKNSFSNTVKINDINRIQYLQFKVWCYCNDDEGNIIVSGNDFYKISFEKDSIESTGWRRLVLSFWIPQNKDLTNLNVSLGNNGSEPIYFDDFQIIKNYKK